MPNPRLWPEFNSTADILRYIVLFKLVLVGDTLTVLLKLLKQISVGAYLESKQSGLTKFRERL